VILPRMRGGLPQDILFTLSADLSLTIEANITAA
jgi:hypothetical protein